MDIATASRSSSSATAAALPSLLLLCFSASRRSTQSPSAVLDTEQRFAPWPWRYVPFPQAPHSDRRSELGFHHSSGPHRRSLLPDPSWRAMRRPDMGRIGATSGGGFLTPTTTIHRPARSPAAYCSS